MSEFIEEELLEGNWPSAALPEDGASAAGYTETAARARAPAPRPTPRPQPQW